MADKKKDEEVPKSITEFYKRSEQVKTLIDITNESHSSAYLEARRKLKEHTGEKGLQVLEKTEHQDYFIDSLINAYLNQIKQNEKIDIPEDKFQQDVLMRRYLGITRDELSRTIRSAKSDYTIGQHEGIRDELVKKQEQELRAVRTSHMSDKDLEDVLKHTKTHKMFDKDKLNLQHAAIILDQYKNSGSFSYEHIDRIAQATKGQLDLSNYLTADAKKEKDALKDKYKQAA